MVNMVIRLERLREMQFAIAIMSLMAWSHLGDGAIHEIGIIDQCADRVGMLREGETGYDSVELRLDFSNGARLTYIGAMHTNDPDDPQLRNIESAITEAQPEIVLHEGYSWPQSNDLRDAARRYYEPGFTQALATSLGIMTGSLEPVEAELWAEVMSKIPALDYQMYLVTRRVGSWAQHGQNVSQVREQAERYIASLQSRGDAWDIHLPIATFDSYQAHFAQTWPDLDFDQIPRDWFNPLLDGSQTGGLFINEANRVESNARNVAMFRRIATLVTDGQAIVAVVGRNHVFQQAPALQCLQAAMESAAAD